MKAVADNSGGEGGRRDDFGLKLVRIMLALGSAFAILIASGLWDFKEKRRRLGLRQVLERRRNNRLRALMNELRKFLRSIASLWFAAVLLMLLLVSMACATIYESMHGTEQALDVFYGSWWFEGLLGLLGFNVLAATLVRFPFNLRKVGFLLAHAGVLVVLIGALLTRHVGVNGDLRLREGATADHFVVPADDITLTDVERGRTVSTELPSSVVGRHKPVDGVRMKPLRLGDVELTVQRYLPDAVFFEVVTNDNDTPMPAVQVALGSGGQPVCIFPGERKSIGGASASLRLVRDDAEAQRLVSISSDLQSQSAGHVRAEMPGGTFDIPLEDMASEPVPLGDTGYSMRLMGYLPHASVVDNSLVNDPNRPLNPAVEVELSSPDGATERRLAFAFFPEFQTMHGGGAADDVRIVLVSNADAMPTAPIEVLMVPGGALYARFVRDDHSVVATPVTVGEEMETPWTGMGFMVNGVYDRARRELLAEPIDPPRGQRMPAVQVEVRTPEGRRQLWINKNGRQDLAQGRFALAYGDRTVDLGFDVSLERFEIGTFPGTDRHRSYESLVTFDSHVTGTKCSRLISMNHPVKQGGFTFFQASYLEDPRGGPSTSVLSVAQDPGQTASFVGFGLLVLGMLHVVAMRISDHRRTSQARAALEARASTYTPRLVDGHPGGRPAVAIPRPAVTTVESEHEPEPAHAMVIAGGAIDGSGPDEPQ